MSTADPDLPAAIQDLCDRLHCDPEVLLALLVSLLERELRQRELDSMSWAASSNCVYCWSCERLHEQANGSLKS